ncbi:VOC family protein [Chloroflexota bacterium]
MADLSVPKVKVTEIHQVAVCVNDLQTVAENYWNILGIGPWRIFSWDDSIVHTRKYHGKPTAAREKIALTRLGDVIFELVQPVEGDSIYQDWLVEHGQGLHHMNFLVDDLDKTVEILAKEGFPPIQSGRFGPPEDKTGYNYVDIEPLRAIWEPVQLGKGIQAEPVLYPDTEQTSPSKVKVSEFSQIGLVVKDVQTVAENYWNILGIGPWEVYSWEDPIVYDRKYHGRPTKSREKIAKAKAQIGEIELVLIQPVEGDSIYQDFLTEHGEGLHHLEFLVDNVDEAAEILAKEGFPSLQSERVGSPENNAAYNYIDIKPLHAIWKLSSLAKDKSLKDFGIEPTYL